MFCPQYRIKVNSCQMILCSYYEQCKSHLDDIETIDQSQKIKKFFAK